MCSIDLFFVRPQVVARVVLVVGEGLGDGLQVENVGEPADVAELGGEARQVSAPEGELVRVVAGLLLIYIYIYIYIYIHDESSKQT